MQERSRVTAFEHCTEVLTNASLTKAFDHEPGFSAEGAGPRQKLLTTQRGSAERNEQSLTLMTHGHRF